MSIEQLQSIICKKYELTFTKTLIMGILNVTSDSFSDGSLYVSFDAAIDHAKQMVADGADIIDVGGESSRPHADSVSEEEELKRVLSVVKHLVKEVDVPISIDTYKPKVAEECIKAGAHIINDITGLRDDKMVDIAATYNTPVIIMHMKGNPQTMQQNPSYKDVVQDIKSFFKERIDKARKAGITSLILDVGIGFGKTVSHNLQLIKRLHEFTSLGYPLLIGPSRKSFIGQITVNFIRVLHS